MNVKQHFISKYISEYIRNETTFSYLFVLNISSKDFRTKIFDFTKTFFEAGHKFGFFQCQDDNILKVLLDKRKRFLYSKLFEESDYIKLVDIENYNAPNFTQMYMSIPNIMGKYDLLPYQRENIRYLEYLQIFNTDSINCLETLNNGFWQNEVSFYIESESTIWLEEIDVYMDEQEGYTRLDFPVDNHFIAYRITPRFNSFLREIKNKIEKLGGIFKLDETESKMKYITENGILLDGRIIYQEDIDEGRVKFPSSSKCS